MPTITIQITRLINMGDGTFEITWLRDGVEYERTITADFAETPRELAQWIVDQPIEGRAVQTDRYGTYEVQVDQAGQVTAVTKVS